MTLLRIKKLLISFFFVVLMCDISAQETLRSARFGCDIDPTGEFKILVVYTDILNDQYQPILKTGQQENYPHLQRVCFIPIPHTAHPGSSRRCLSGVSVWRVIISLASLSKTELTPKKSIIISIARLTLLSWLMVLN